MTIQPIPRGGDPLCRAHDIVVEPHHKPLMRLGSSPRVGVQHLYLSNRSRERVLAPRALGQKRLYSQMTGKKKVRSCRARLYDKSGKLVGLWCHGHNQYLEPRLFQPSAEKAGRFNCRVHTSLLRAARKVFTRVRPSGVAMDGPVIHAPPHSSPRTFSEGPPQALVKKGCWRAPPSGGDDAGGGRLLTKGELASRELRPAPEPSSPPEKRQRTSPPPAEAKAPTAPPHVPPPEVAAEGGSPEVAAEFVGDDSPQAAAAGIDSPQEEVVRLPKAHPWRKHQRRRRPVWAASRHISDGGIVPVHRNVLREHGCLPLGGRG